MGNFHFSTFGEPTTLALPPQNPKQFITCTGTLSRNYTVGYKLGRGETLSDVISKMKMVAEGVATSKSAYELSIKHDVEMPIVEQIFRVINENKNPVDAVKELMTRTLKAEY